MLTCVIRRDPTREVAYLNLFDAYKKRGFQGDEDKACEAARAYIAGMTSRERLIPPRVFQCVDTK